MKLRVRIFQLAAIWLVSTAAAAAAAPTPTSEQLEIFQNLTPEQQQAVLDQLSKSEQATGEDSSMERAALGTSTLPETDRRRTPQAIRSSAAPEIPVLESQDSVLVEVEIPETLIRPFTEADRERLESLSELIGSRNPYQLDRSANLNLPGFAPIALAGLTDKQATQRLLLEPALRPLELRLSRLPLSRTGVAGLKPFGYDLFDNAPSTFSPVTDIPVPADYVVGAGDELNVQLFGSQNRNLRLTVNRDGAISFPELGPIRVSGMTFNAARQAIESRVSEQLIGVQASVSMGEMRTIRVFVTGDARVPGSYPVSGLATMTTALFASGGVKEIGSLRNIQLKRQGQIVRTLDLYDLLISGDTSDDAKLLPGDVIFIPPIGPTVSVDGEVKRPAIYELRTETPVADVIQIAGGLTAEADRSRGSLTRLDNAGRRVVADVNLSRQGGGEAVGNGDVLRIARLRPQIDAGVVLEGYVHRAGPVAWRDGLRLTDVIGSIDELQPNADQHYILIRRENPADRRVSVISADLSAALAGPGSGADVVLAPRDRIVVFDLAPGRERIIRPLLAELQLQSDLTRPTEVVEVGGRVNVPGQYPLEPGMRVSDLLRAGGNLHTAAYGADAELVRTVTDSGARRTELLDIDLIAIQRGDAGADVLLQPFDYLVVKETPDWSDQESITLRGEVRFPGTYPLRRGETLRQVLDRAGGLTSLAFPEGAAFTREYLRELEQQQLDRLEERMRADLASLALQAANAGQSSASEALQSGQVLMSQLQNVTATGRFVIDLPGLLTRGVGSEKDVMLRHGDELVVPKLRQEVMVIGEVQNATAHLYQPNLSRADYISMSGGTTKKADRGRINVVRADGSVATRGGSFFSRNYDVAIRPGDTIIVPLDTERMPRLPFWQAVTQILYNLTVSVAAINSF